MDSAKQLLTASNLLTHYDPSLPMKVAADASQYGLGAVISHVLPNGEERPIAFASRSLSPSEINYSQIDKEALTLIYGVRMFYNYLYGRKFTLVTDHKPLTSILGPKTGVPSLAAARIATLGIAVGCLRLRPGFEQLVPTATRMPYRDYHCRWKDHRFLQKLVYATFAGSNRSQ